MNYAGKATIYFDDEPHGCFVVLDPENSIIECKIPVSPSSLGFKPFKSIFSKDYVIENLKCALPNGQIECLKITDLILTYYHSGILSEQDSTLVQALSLSEKVSMLTLKFIPTKSIINFTYVSQKVHSTKSELIFFNNKLRALLDLSLGRRKISFSGDPNFLVVRSNNNLLGIRSILENAIALSQAGRPTYRSGLYQNNLELHFDIISQNIPLGPIFNDNSTISIFIEKYFKFRVQLKGEQKNRHDLFVSYFLDGLLSTLHLDNRVINLFTAIEIIDNSVTLNKNSLKSILKMEIDHADFCIRVRNSLIHEGLTLPQAVYFRFKEIKSHIPAFIQPFKVLNVKKSKAASNIYFFLLAYIYKYIGDLIGIEEQVGFHNDYK